MPLARKVAFLAAAILVAQSLTSAAAAAPTASWHRDLGRELRGVAVDRHGNAFVTGYVRSGARRLRTLVVARYGPDGTRRWVRTWRPIANSETEGNDVAVGRDGRIYVAGAIRTVDGTSGGWVLSAYGPGGKLRWHRRHPGWRTTDRTSFATGVAAGGSMVAIAGSTTACCGGPFHDGWVKTFKTDGHLRWNHPFEVPGFGGFDLATDVAIGGRGAVYAVGRADQKPITSPTDVVDREAVFMKLAADGSTTWIRVLRDRNVRDEDTATSVAVRGKVLVVGAHLDGTAVTDPWRLRGHAWLGRLSLAGTLLWERSWGQRRANAQQIDDVAVGPGGAIRLVGTARGSNDGVDAYVRAFSTDGKARGRVRLDVGRYLHGTGIATATRGGAFWVTAWKGTARADRPDGGRLWRFRP
jgi:hypothetical protein